MKYKCSLIENFIPLTSCQIDIAISLIRRSDERFALVRGAYYKDIVKDVGEQGCCNQTFYTGLQELEKHGIIRVSKESDLDFDVYICGNEYPEHTKVAFEGEPYINFNADVFTKRSFKRLKAHEKYLFLYFYQYTFPNKGKQTKILNKKMFYKEMMDKLSVTKPVLRKYLHSLKLFFSIGTVKGNLLVTRLKVTNTNKEKGKTEEQHMLEQYIISQCHRLKMDYHIDVVKGLTKYIREHRSLFKENGTLVLISKMMKAMERSIAGYKPKERKLNGGLINKLLTYELRASDHEEQPDMEAIYNMENMGLCF